ncbi:MAG: thioesterase family protein [Planctomycetota bacterium]|jgi:acyl-CoA thioester hydrolase|nr:thioesterase family protein [Planctomycetota bacterium]MSR39443.1 acyl-CoA thioesterase [Planctomycetota bacterium]
MKAKIELPYEEPPHRIRVRYCETDRMGIAHHGSYVAWFEDARTEWLRRMGKTYRQMEDEGNLLQVVAFEARYQQPVDYDDEILIRIRVAERSKVALVLEYEVRRVDSQVVATLGRTKLACVGRDGKLRRLPKELA